MATKTVCQHSEKLPEDTMEFLRGIAADYAKVKNAVYERYSGVRSIERINYSFNVQKEMRFCGLRQQLNLPSAYYDLAVVEALTNIKAMWSGLKNKIRGDIRNRESLSDDDRYYIRTVLKLDKVFAAVINRQPYDLPRNVCDSDLEFKRLNNLLCRLVRRHMVKPRAINNTQFQVIKNGYRYKDNGLYLGSRQPRKRVFIPLKDNQVSSRQLRISVLADRVIIHFPVDVEVKEPEAGASVVYAYIGYQDALTLSNGNVYGKNLANLVTPETERLCLKNARRNRLRSLSLKKADGGDLRKALRIEANNLGKKKYEAQKRRIRERTQNYLNAEINRMLATEKPRCIVITKPIGLNPAKRYAKVANRRLTRSFAGFIRKRLAEKCQFRGIKLISISSKDTGSLCSSCGAVGARDKTVFRCEACGYEATVAQNSALNIKKKARAEGIF